MGKQVTSEGQHLLKVSSHLGQFKQMLLRIIQSGRTMLLTVLSSYIRKGQGLCIDKNWILSSIAVGNSSSPANPGMGSKWTIALLGRSWSLRQLVWKWLFSATNEDIQCHFPSWWPPDRVFLKKCLLFQVNDLINAIV